MSFERCDATRRGEESLGRMGCLSSMCFRHAWSNKRSLNKALRDQRSMWGNLAHPEAPLPEQADDCNERYPWEVLMIAMVCEGSNAGFMNQTVWNSRMTFGWLHAPRSPLYHKDR